MLERFRRFMMGRYGPDQMTNGLIILGIIISVIGQLCWLPICIWISYILFIYTFFRMFSRNIEARQKENWAFLRVWQPMREWFIKVGKWFSAHYEMIKQRKQYKYFKCPNCGLQLRAPRGRGKIQVTCQKCHKEFIKKT